MQPNNLSIPEIVSIENSNYPNQHNENIEDQKYQISLHKEQQSTPNNPSSYNLQIYLLKHSHLSILIHTLDNQ